MSNKDNVVLAIIRLGPGGFIWWIDKANKACRGKSQYLKGNVNHSFQLKKHSDKVSMEFNREDNHSVSRSVFR